MNNIKRIDLNKVCKDYGARTIPYKHAPEIIKRLQFGKPDVSGLTVIFEGGPVIFYNDSLPEQEVRFTVAHELGHILLGHLNYRLDGGHKCPDFAEMEANCFAAAIIVNDILCRYGEEV